MLLQTREIERMIQVLPVPKTLNITRIEMAIEAQRLLASSAKRNMWHPGSGYHTHHMTDPEPGRWKDDLAYAALGSR